MVIDNHICIICGKPFFSRRSRAKYCSEDCAAKSRKIRHREFYRRKKAVIRKSDAALTCAVCGKPLNDILFRRKYCSDECYQRAYTRNYPRYKVCKNCGKSFNRPAWGSYPFCSKTCELAYYSKCSKKLDKKIKEARNLKMSLGKYLTYLHLGLNPVDFAEV